MQCFLMSLRSSAEEVWEFWGCFFGFRIIERMTLTLVDGDQGCWTSAMQRTSLTYMIKIITHFASLSNVSEDVHVDVKSGYDRMT